MKNVSVAMLDDLAPLAARLSKSLKSHQVNASTDTVLDHLSQMVDAMASGKRPVLASADTNDSEAPAYNTAADFITTAFAHFSSGQTEKALKYVLIAFQADGMVELAQAMSAMNDEATEDDGEVPDVSGDQSILAAVADDSDEDGDEDDASSPFTNDGTDGSDQSDSWNIFDGDDEDEDNEDDADGNEDDSSVIEGVLSEMSEPAVMDVSDDDQSNDDDDDEDSLTNRFRSVSASTTTSQRDSTILANKVGLTGMPEARRVGKQLLRG